MTVCYVLFPDINECDDGTHNCLADAVCSNNEGSYSCDCAVGFSGDGRISCDGKLDSSLHSVEEYVKARFIIYRYIDI